MYQGEIINIILTDDITPTGRKQYLYWDRCRTQCCVKMHGALWVHFPACFGRSGTNEQMLPGKTGDSRVRFGQRVVRYIGMRRIVNRRIVWVAVECLVVDRIVGAKGWVWVECKYLCLAGMLQGQRVRGGSLWLQGWRSYWSNGWRFLAFSWPVYHALNRCPLLDF